MVVVVASVGVIAGVSFPAISASLESVRMVSATDTVATFLNSAVNRAERRQHAVAREVDSREGTLSLFSAEPGDRKEMHLPGGVVIEAVTPADGDDRRSPAGFCSCLGHGPRDRNSLGNGHNAHRLVHLDPMTGFPRVESIDTGSLQ